MSLRNLRSLAAAQRPALDALGKVGGFLQIVSVRGLLAGVAGPLKRNSVRVEERQRFVNGAGMDVIRELTGVILGFLRAEFPDDLKPGAASGADRIGNRNHAAELRLVNLRDVMLNYKSIANGLDVNRHRPAVVGARGSGRDVRMRAALIFGVGEMEQPVRDVHLFNRRVDRGGYRGEAECAIVRHKFLSLRTKASRSRR